MAHSHYSISDIQHLPSNPGIYHFYDKKENIIYIGKAKNIKKRVKSYFNNAQHKLSIKTKKMVGEIAYIYITIVNSEYEALLLENNLIKNHQPKYNILLRDDKTYPYLCITRERFPKLISTRHIDIKKGVYFGPFTDTVMMQQVLDLIKKFYPLRTCHYDLSAVNIAQKKFKVCLAYHIKNCKGPCEGLQAETDYNQMISEVKKILKGDFVSIKKDLVKKMQIAAQKLDFEIAQDYKEKCMALEKYQSKSCITNPQNKHFDVFSIIDDQYYVYVSYLKIQHGMIVFTKTEAVKKKIEENKVDVLLHIIINYRKQFQSEAREILLNTALHVAYDQLFWTVPQIGDKKKLVNLALENAFLLKQKMVNKSVIYIQKYTNQLKCLQKDLKLPTLPVHIECFDNSNIQGKYPVAAMVCFKNGVPEKKQYRKFHIKTVQGPDDFASMKEVVLRRYKHFVDNGLTLPDLIVIDGGKGQLNAAIQALKELDIDDSMSIISIAKKFEEIFFPQNPNPLQLDPRSPSLHLLQKIRDETHRFAISFHRNIRDKNTLQKSLLHNIAGIGPVTQQKLCKHYPSIVHIQKATFLQLQSIIGKSKAEIIAKHFSSKKK